MAAETPDLRKAVRQWLDTDRRFGLTFVPLPGEVLARLQPAAPLPAAASSSVKAISPVNGAAEDAAARLTALDRDHVRGCQKCGLCAKRTQTVFGVGHPGARLVFVGEGPGFEEDRQGIPFVGKAGQLLTRMIAAMGLRRDDVYICNVVKCRPPNNRDPSAEEIQACSPYLHEQLRIIQPAVIVALGSPAAKTLLDTTAGIGRLRGRFHDFKLRHPDGAVTMIPLMPTYHPAYLLRSPGEKHKTWDDLQQVMGALGVARPAGNG